jgi:hypothetical protein
LDGESDYISSFSRSLSLVLEEFYKNIKYVSVSSKSGEGFEDLLKKVQETVVDYLNEKEKSS